MAGNRVPISGSEVKGSGVPLRREAADPDEVIDATIVIRPPSAAKQMGADLLAGRSSARSREDVRARLTADPGDWKVVLDFVCGQGLAVVEQNAQKRMVRVAGTVRQMNAAFDIELEYVVGPAGNRYLSYRGALKAPAPVAAAVTAVLGLHREPVAQPRRTYG